MNTSYFKFTGYDTKYPGYIIGQSDNVISLAFDGAIPKADTVTGKGAAWHTAGGVALGDYADYTTVYRWGDGYYQMSNDGSIYIAPEPTPAPAPTETELRITELNSIIAQNKTMLAESDYKVIKNSEYAEAGINVEYEPMELNAERQILRDAINAAESDLAELLSQ